MRVRVHNRLRRTRGAKWLQVAAAGVAALGLALTVAFAMWRGARAAGAADPPEVKARAASYLASDETVTLTLEQERTRTSALASLPSPCCKKHTLAEKCCSCTLAKTISGLTKQLIADEHAPAEEVTAAAKEWIAFADKDGFPGHACMNQLACHKPFRQHGCGGMGGTGRSLRRRDRAG